MSREKREETSKSEKKEENNSWHLLAISSSPFPNFWIDSKNPKKISGAGDQLEIRNAKKSWWEEKEAHRGRKLNYLAPFLMLIYYNECRMLTFQYT